MATLIDLADAALIADTGTAVAAATVDIDSSSGTTCGTPWGMVLPSCPSSAGSFRVATGVLYRALVAFCDADNGRFRA